VINETFNSEDDKLGIKFHSFDGAIKKHNYLLKSVLSDFKIMKEPLTKNPTKNNSLLGS
jgi:hypothetical protein